MKNAIVNKVAALDKVVMICNAHGANYNPSNAALKPTALAALLKLAQEKIEAVNVARATFMMAANARTDGFEGIPKLAAQVVRMVSASSASKTDKDDVRKIKARFHQRRKVKSIDQPQTQGTAMPESPETRSISRRDRDSMMDNLRLLIEAVQKTAAYDPNEPEFKVDGLKAKVEELQALNFASMQAKLQLSNARIALREVMNGSGGVIETTRAAKDYIRARFGMVSMQSQQLNNNRSL